MTKNEGKDIIEWDIVNWTHAIYYWSKNIDLKSSRLNCLELGSNKGGLSLWLALNGNSVICSDLESPEKLAAVKNKGHYWAR